MDRYPKNHLKTAAVAALCFLIFISALPAKETSNTSRIPVSLSINSDETLTRVVRDAPVVTSQSSRAKIIEPPSNLSMDNWIHISIRRGDSLAAIFNRAGLSPRDLYEIMSLGPAVKRLKKILPKK